MRNLTEPQKRVIAAKIAKELWLAHPTKWASARDSNGYPCASIGPEATSWCAVGALRCVAYYVSRSYNDLLLEDFNASLGELPDRMNDSGRLTPAHWDTWIAKLESEAK